MPLWLGVIGTLFGAILVIYLCYKDWNIIYAVLIGSIFIIATSGMDPFELINAGMSEVANMYKNQGLACLFGCFIAKIFTDAHVAQSFANGILNTFVKDGSYRKKVTFGLGFALLFAAVMGYIGSGNMFMTAAVYLGMMYALDIPRKYLIVLMMVGNTIGQTMPGNMGLNIMLDMFLGPNQFPEASHWNAFFPCLIAGLILMIVGTWLIVNMICKEKEKNPDGHFEWGPLAGEHGNQDADTSAYPPPFLLLVPVAVVLVVYILQGTAWVSVACGFIVALVMFYKYLPEPAPDKLTGKTAATDKAKNVMNAAMGSFGIWAGVQMNMFIGAIIGAVPAFGAISNFFANLPFPTEITYALMGTFLTGICSGPSGLMTTLFTARDVYIPAGMHVGAARVIGQLTTSVLDDLPTNATIVVMCAWAGVGVKESYKPIIYTSLILPFIGLAIAVALLIAFPGLAVG